MLRKMLHDERSKRIRPGLDDKILADWNGLMIAALVHAANAFDEPEWISLARRAFDFIAHAMTRGNRLGHSFREGKLLLPGLASDYAAMIRAALALYEATFEQTYLDQAVIWQQALERHYRDHEHGGYYLTADDAEGLIIRPHSTIDDAIPNHNGLIAQNLVRLHALTGDAQWRERVENMFGALLPKARDNMFGHLSLLNALDLQQHAAEIVVVGKGDEAHALLDTARRLPHATTILQHVAKADNLPASHPAAAKAASLKGSPETQAAAFVCRGQTCSLPVTTPDALRAAVASSLP